MRTTLTSFFVLLIGFGALSQTFIKSTTLTVDYVASKKEYWHHSMENMPNFLCKGVDLQGDRLVFYTRFFREGVVRKGSGSFTQTKYMIPTVGILSTDLALERPSLDFYNIRLYDIDKAGPYTYQTSSGNMLTQPGEENLPEEFKKKTFEIIGDDKTDKPLTELENKYPMLFEPLKTEPQHLTGVSGVTAGSRFLFQYKDMVSKPYKAAICGYEGITDNSRSARTTENALTEKNKVVALEYPVYNPDKKEWFGISSEKDPEVKWSVFKFYHFAVYNENGEVVNKHEIKYEFLKGIDHIQYVPDMDKTGEGVYMVLLNSVPVLGLGKLKEPNKDKHHVLIFDATGKLLYQVERDVASNNNYYSPIYAYKKGEEVFLLEYLGNGGTSSFHFMKINKDGVQKVEKQIGGLVGEAPSMKLSISDKFIVCGSKRVGNKLYVWGNQRNHTTGASYETVYSYPSLHVIEFDVEKNETGNIYAFARKEGSVATPSVVDEVIESNGNLFLMSHLTLRARTEADKAMTNLCNSNQYVVECFPNNDLTVPIIYGARSADKRAVTFMSPDSKFINLFPRNHYVMKDGFLYLFGYNETAYGKTTFQILKVGL